MVGLLFCAENGGFVDVVFRTGLRTNFVGVFSINRSVEKMSDKRSFCRPRGNDSTEVPPVLWHFISRKIQYPIDFLEKTWYNIFTE